VTTAQTLLAELKARGISAREMSGNLRLRPHARIPSDLLERLRPHKVALLQAVRLDQLLRLDDDRLDAWAERVAICTIDGGLSDAAAEAVAWAQIDAGKSENLPSLGRQNMVMDQ
jgi:hypothetical protein